MGKTFDDIAAEAGVSRATVSRFFNGSVVIRPATEQRIREVVERHQYAPPKVRRGPKSARKGSPQAEGIALVAVGGSAVVLSHPNTAAMVETLQTECHRRGFGLLLDQMSDPAQTPFSLSSKQAAACIAVGAGARRQQEKSESARACIRKLAELVPCALLFSPGHAVGSVPHFTGNDVAIGSAAFRALRAEGIKEAILAYPDPWFHEAAVVRARAFLDRAALAGLPTSVWSHAAADFDPARHFAEPIRRFESEEELARALSGNRTTGTAGLFVPLDDSVRALHRALEAERVLSDKRILLATASTARANIEGLDPRPVCIGIGLERICAALVDHLAAEIRGESGRKESGTFLAPPEAFGDARTTDKA